ncbi:MAG: tetratricopeptide repeat protein [Verrucomicrobiota bacterium]
MRRDVLICLALFVITLIGFWPVGRLGFIYNYDDEVYVTANPNVQAGVTAKSILWAFTTTRAANWHPLTWLSHMLDCQLFGLDASGHHWSSLGFHLVNTLLLFGVLRQMTGAVWRSVLVAALFALHPTRVESVAWIAEPSPRFGTASRCQVTGPEKVMPASVWSRVTCHPSLFYWLALLGFALGLMCKPMLVTLPIVLLLLDFWPLGRWRPAGGNEQIPEPTRRINRENWQPLVIEKLPFLGLSLAAGFVTFVAQREGGAVVSLGVLPWETRVVYSLVHYVAYVEKIFWPEHLSVFHPYRLVNPWDIAGCVLLLAGISVFCVRRAHAQPYLLVGWLWFLIMLLPVIGLVQAGWQAMADRYAYLPAIGLFISVVWGMAEVASTAKLLRAGFVSGAAVLTLACLLITRHQINYWRDAVTLFSHVVEVTGESVTGNFNLGHALWRAGDLDGAVRNYRIVNRIEPDTPDVYYHLGAVLLLQKKYEAAETQFGEAETRYLTAARVQANAGNAGFSQLLMQAAHMAEVQKNVAALYETLRAKPTRDIRDRIAVLQTELGQLQTTALGPFQTGLGQFQDAAGHYNEALRLNPDSTGALNNLAWLLATCSDASVRNGARAVQLAERACQLTDYRQTLFVGTLAAAYAEAGRFNDAMATAEKAIALAEENHEPELLQKNRELLELYRAHQSYRDAGGSTPAGPSTNIIPSRDAEAPVHIKP